MWVDQPHIGDGVGRALFEHAADTARAHGGSVLMIASDPNAEGFYKRMGAQPAGTVAGRPAGRKLPLLELVLRD
jgi:GNAT superfamily N-acetyltransferase